MSIYKWRGETTSTNTNLESLYEFLISVKNQNNSFLSDKTIELNSNVLTITKGDSVFTIATGASGEGNYGYYSFTNGDYSATIKRQSYSSNQNANAIMWAKNAIVCESGLIIETGVSSANSPAYPTNYTGSIILVDDSKNLMSAILNNVSITYSAITTGNNLYIIAGESLDSQEIAFTPNFNMQKTALMPLVIVTPLGDTTLPVFYASFQTQLPGVGLQAGRMDSTDYITNGYCFIRDV